MIKLLSVLKSVKIKFVPLRKDHLLITGTADLF